MQLTIVLKGDGSGLTGTVKVAEGDFLRLGAAADSAGAATRRTAAGVRDLGQASERTGGQLRGTVNAVNTLRGTLATLGITFVAREMLQAELASQRYGATLEAITGTQAAAGREMAFLRSEANRLGVFLPTLADAYVGLAAATKGTNLEGQKTRDIFLAVAEAGRVYKLRADQVLGALYAIQQIASKGAVSMEELRRQLGDRLYGAFNIAARGMGLTTAELTKLVETGQLAADDFLPKFAAELRATTAAGLELAAASPAAEFERLKTAIYDLAVAAADGGLMDALVDGARELTSAIEDNQDVIREFGGLLGTLARQVDNVLVAVAAFYGARGLAGLTAALRQQVLAMAATEAAYEMMGLRINRTATVMLQARQAGAALFAAMGGWTTVVAGLAYGIYSLIEAHDKERAERMQAITSIEELTERMREAKRIRDEMANGATEEQVLRTDKIREAEQELTRLRSELERAQQAYQLLADNPAVAQGAVGMAHAISELTEDVERSAQALRGLTDALVDDAKWFDPAIMLRDELAEASKRAAKAIEDHRTELEKEAEKLKVQRIETEQGTRAALEYQAMQVAGVQTAAELDQGTRDLIDTIVRQTSAIDGAREAERKASEAERERKQAIDELNRSLNAQVDAERKAAIAAEASASDYRRSLEQELQLAGLDNDARARMINQLQTEAIVRQMGDQWTQQQADAYRDETQAILDSIIAREQAADASRQLAEENRRAAEEAARSWADWSLQLVQAARQGTRSVKQLFRDMIDDMVNRLLASGLLRMLGSLFGGGTSGWGGLFNAAAGQLLGGGTGGYGGSGGGMNLLSLFGSGTGSNFSFANLGQLFTNSNGAGFMSNLGNLFGMGGGSGGGFWSGLLQSGGGNAGWLSNVGSLFGLGAGAAGVGTGLGTAGAYTVYNGAVSSSLASYGVANTANGLGSTAAAGAGSSAASMAIPIIGWIIAGMMANNGAYHAGYRANPRGRDSGLPSWDNYVGSPAVADSLLQSLGMGSYLASMISGSSLHTMMWGHGRPVPHVADTRFAFGSAGVTGSTDLQTRARGGWFSGPSYHWERGLEVPQEAIDAMQGMFDRLKEVMTGAAKQLGNDSVQMIEGALRVVEKFTKSGKPKGTEYVVEFMGRSWTEATQELATTRLYGEALISAIDQSMGNTAPALADAITQPIGDAIEDRMGPIGRGIGDLIPKADTGTQGEASAIAERWRDDAEALARGAETLLAIATDIHSGFDLLQTGTLTPIVDLIDELGHSGESMLDTYQRLAQSTMLLEQAVAAAGITVDKTREEFVRWAVDITEAAGGLDQANALWSNYQANFLSGTERATFALDSIRQAASAAFEDAGLSLADFTGSGGLAAFREMFEQRLPNATAEEVVQLLRLAQVLVQVTQAENELEASLHQLQRGLAAAAAETNEWRARMAGRIASAGGLDQTVPILAQSMNDLRAAIDLSGPVDEAIADLETFAQSVDDWMSAALSAVDANLDATRQSIEAQLSTLDDERSAIMAAGAERARAAAETQRAAQEAQRQAIQAQIEGLQEQLRLAQAMQQVVDQATQALRGLQFGTANPAAASVRASLLQGEIDRVRAQYSAAGGADRARLATDLLGLLQQRQSMAQDLFQRPSREALDAYNQSVTEIAALRDDAQTEADRAVALQERIAQLQERANSIGQSSYQQDVILSGAEQARLAAIDAEQQALRDDLAAAEFTAQQAREAIRQTALDQYNWIRDTGEALRAQRHAEILAQIGAVEAAIRGGQVSGEPSEPYTGIGPPVPPGYTPPPSTIPDQGPYGPPAPPPGDGTPVPKSNGGLVIQQLTINGATGDGAEFARKFIEEAERQASRLKRITARA